MRADRQAAGRLGAQRVRFGQPPAECVRTSDSRCRAAMALRTVGCREIAGERPSTEGRDHVPVEVTNSRAHLGGARPTWSGIVSPFVWALALPALGPHRRLPYKGCVARSAKTLLKRIAVDPDRMGGKPALRAWRISVEQILTWLANGTSREQILAEFPRLKAGDIDACLLYAAGSSLRD